MKVILSERVLRLLAASFACIVATTMDVSAAEYYRTLTILRVAAVSGTRPASPSSQALFRIYVAPSAWGTSACRIDAADASSDDWQVNSVLLNAYKNNQNVTVTVDDTLKLDNSDNTCRIIGVAVN